MAWQQQRHSMQALAMAFAQDSDASGSDSSEPTKMLGKNDIATCAPPAPVPAVAAPAAALFLFVVIAAATDSGA